MAQCVSFTVATPATPADIDVVSVTMTPSYATFNVGETITLTATLRNYGGTAGSANVYFYKGTYSPSAVFSTKLSPTVQPNSTTTVAATYTTTSTDTGTTVSLCATT